VTFTPALNYNGPAEFTYTISDGKGGTSTAKVYINICPVNDAPIDGDEINTVTEDVTLIVAATATTGLLANSSDVEGDALCITSFMVAGIATPVAVTAATPGVANIAGVGIITIKSDGSYSFAPALNYTGEIPVITYKVSDGHGGTDTSTLTLKIRADNIAPDAVDDNITGNEDTPVVIAVATLLANDSDADGNPLTVTDVQDATNGAVVLVNGVVTFTPNPNYNGPASFTYTISDGKGGFDTATVNLNIQPINDAPVDGDETNTVVEDTTLDVAAAAGLLANARDVDGDSLSITSFSVAGNTVAVSAANPGVADIADVGVLTINSDGSYSFVPALNYTGEIPVVTYTVSDGQGGTDTSTLTLTIDPRNDAPDAVDDGEFDAGVILGQQDTVLTIDPIVLLANDTDVDGDTLTVSDVLDPTNGAVDIVNGQVVFTPTPGYYGPASFTYIISDGNGGTDTATFFLDIAIAPQLEIAQLTLANVSEEGLLGGLADTLGNPDTGNATSNNGDIAILNASGPLTVSLALPTEVLSSGGVAVTWTGAGTQLLTATAGNSVVATVSIDNAGNYTINLLKPIDHTGVGEDVKELNFTVNVTDGTQTATGVLRVGVEDDAPVATDVRSTLSTINTNLLITLDTSSSMNDPSGIAGLTRLQAAVQSVKQLINTYDSFGDVNVRLVTFSDNANSIGTVWVSVNEANNLLNSIATTGSTTNYDGALSIAIDAFADPGKIDGAQNVSYFLSDGSPNRGDGNEAVLSNLGNTILDAGIQVAEEVEWVRFLNANQIKSYAIGMGPDVPVAKLNPIAHDGQAQTNLDGAVVAQFSDLDGALASTVTAFAAGQLFSGGLLNAGSGIGADGGFVQSITVENIVYTFDPTNISVSSSNNSAVQFDAVTKQLTVILSSTGQFVVDMDEGSYQYFAPAQLNSSITESFGYVIVDKDGDNTSATVSLDVAKANTILGTANAETLTGTAGTDKISGLAGDDTLRGEAGNDVLFGGDGNDTIAGGTGNDLMIGGLGADTFIWSLADTTASGVASDKITDFNPLALNAGGDALNLRDLLQGETANDLSSYLHFEKTGADTVLHVSSNAGYAAGFNAANDAQIITLTGVDLVASFANDQAIIANLLTNQKLITD
jgi:large repetitive protein